MKNNITLIGMPGAGKSTVGTILAKNMAMGFIDTDILIQINNKKSLQQILNEKGYKTLRRIEEREILKLNISSQIIATGGSAVYSEKAMTHLQNISRIVFLKADLDVIKMRINNFDTRGIACDKNQSFEELFYERQVLYEKYGDFTIDCNTLTQEGSAELIEKKLSL